jgi:peptide/nickel transport system permease protein
MIRFLTLRIVEILVVLAIMSFVIYALIGLMPGDPIDLMITANPKLTAADIIRLKAAYGIDQPLIGRYLAWLGAVLQGDLGFSRLYSQPSIAILLPRLGNSSLLMGASFVLALAIGLPAGIAAARRPGSVLDHAINIACFAGISVPSFWLALTLILVFAVALGWFPAGGLATIGDGGIVDRAQHLVLPVATLTLASIGGYTRFMRAAMAEALRQDFVRTARAKGAGERRVVLHHALRNAMIPVVTVVALSFGTLFSGALITETMFAYPGMGKLIFDAVMGNDYNLALAGLLFATLVTLLANLAADVAYAWLDPRITYR